MRPMKTFWVVALGAAVAILAAPVSAELALSTMFSDHMVLQQQQAVPVWGTADPGASISVSINGKTARTKADDAGAWSVELEAMKAGGPFSLDVVGEEDRITLVDVLVGEVWVCSGQSNMQWTVANSNNPDEEIANADHPQLRLYTVPRKTADTPQSSCEGRWSVCSPETIPSFSAVAYYFGREVQANQNVPVGLIHTSWGGTPAESWTRLETLQADDEFAPLLERWDGIVENYPTALEKHKEAVAKWEKLAADAKAAGKDAPKKPRAPTGPDSPHRPASLSNGMIAPVVPYGIQGAIWYQGESNAGRAYQYRNLFSTMIEDWRDFWDNDDDFPFLFVQLANFRAREDQPVESEWAELREAQNMALDLPNTGMAVAIDIGEADDIHPRNKQDVGKRLAMAAEAVAYKEAGADRTGPLYAGMKTKGDTIEVKFDYVDDGLQAEGDTIKGFAIAGEDKQFVWADAQIKGKNTVVVSSSEVTEPVAVRYGWANNPEVNLYNSEGLPVSPFRTDDWPGLTVDNK